RVLRARAGAEVEICGGCRHHGGHGRTGERSAHRGGRKNKKSFHSLLPSVGRYGQPTDPKRHGSHLSGRPPDLFFPDVTLARGDAGEPRYCNCSPASTRSYSRRYAVAVWVIENRSAASSRQRRGAISATAPRAAANWSSVSNNRPT